MSDSVPLPSMFSVGAIENRRSERIHCHRLVQLLRSDHRELAATCTDVNECGIGIDCDRVLAVGQRVQLLLSKEQRVPMLVIYRMDQHYGLSALGSCELLLELLTQQ
jgi:hypothetical protein